MKILGRLLDWLYRRNPRYPAVPLLWAGVALTLVALGVTAILIYFGILNWDRLDRNAAQGDPPTEPLPGPDRRLKPEEPEGPLPDDRERVRDRDERPPLPAPDPEPEGPPAAPLPDAPPGDPPAAPCPIATVSAELTTDLALSACALDTVDLDAEVPIAPLTSVVSGVTEMVSQAVQLPVPSSDEQPAAATPSAPSATSLTIDIQPDGIQIQAGAP